MMGRRGQLDLVHVRLVLEDFLGAGDTLLPVLPVPGLLGARQELGHLKW